MCIFTHFAAGALVGAVTGNPLAALAAGLVSHALLDLFPHYDFPNWRHELILGAVPLLLLLVSPWASWPAVIGGLAGCLPDVENLLQKLGRLERRRMIFPTHTGLLRHGGPRGPRNLWVQAALAVACLAALGLVEPARAEAAASAVTAAAVDPAAPWDVTPAQPASAAPLAVVAPQRARLLAAGDGATRLEVSFPLEVAPADWAQTSAARVRWREAGPLVRGEGDATSALPSAHAWLLAVPTTEAPTVASVDVVWWKEPSVPVDPASLVTVEGPELFRGVPLAVVRVTGQAPGGGVPARIVIALDHPPAGAPAAALAAAARGGIAAKGAPAEAAFGASGVLNPELFARLTAGEVLRAPAAKDVPTHPFGLTTNWVRLEVAATGVYRITGYDLSLLQISSAQVDPATLRLYRGGGLPQSADPVAAGSWQEGWTGLTEVAIDVTDDGGAWASGDALTFYGVGGDAWRDRYAPTASRLDRFEHPGSANGIYWLTWQAPGTASPLPGTARRIGASVPAPALGGEVATTWRARLHREESYEDAAGRLADNWAWDTRIRSSKDLTFDAGAVVAGQPALFVVDVRGYHLRSTSDAVVNQATIWLNGDNPGSVTRQWTVGSEADSQRVRVVGTSTALQAGVNHLWLRNDLGATGGIDMILDSFDVLYWQPLTKGASAALTFAHWGDEVSAPATPVDVRVSLPDAAPVTLWDVSDADAPIALAGEVATGASPTLTAGLLYDPGQTRQFCLFGAGDPATPPVRARRYPTDLRATLGPADYVIIYHPLFSAAAQDLADLRGQVLPGVSNPVARPVSVETIYDNFSGGRKDPWAVRNFLKWLYLRDADPANPVTGQRLKYVCFLGDASRDYRNYLIHDPLSQLYDFVPTVVRTVFPRRAQTWSYQDPFASDDALTGFDAVPPGERYDVPDLASGRLTARDAAEALAMVRRIRAATLAPEPGLWRNRVVFAADDLSHGGFNNETWHTEQAEELANGYLPTTIDPVKLYMVEYASPPGSVAKPAARQEARRLWNEGLTIFHYIGHGSENVLADEQLFLTEDIAGLANGARRGFFIAFSCDVGVFDSPLSQSMAETFVAQESGGAIAAIAASQVSFVSSNDQLSVDFYADLYPLRAVDPRVTPGRALLLAKRSSFDLANSQRYTLFGDPAFRPPQPAAGLVLAPGSVDTLRAGERAVVVAPLPGLPGAAYDLRVEESRHDRALLIPGTMTYLNYYLPGAPAFRGAGEATADPLRVPFKTPLQLHYGPHGRVRLIVDGLDGPVAAAVEVPVVAAASGGVTDVNGPAIALAFPDGRYRVPPGSALSATIADSSGVSVLGTTPNSSVLFELDGSGVLTDVTDNFVFNPGSYTQGRVDLALPGDLTSGPHRLALYASDVLGNVGADTLAFQVVPAGVAGFSGVTLFPNPTPGDCRLVFELSEPMTVDWDVYTVSGRRLRHLQEDFASPGPKLLRWDGRDAEGDAIANGVYLYVLRGRRTADPAHEVRETGQIVLMK